MYCVVAPKITTAWDEVARQVTSTEGITTEINLCTEIERVQRMANRTVRTFDAKSVICTHLRARSKKEKHLPLPHCKFPRTTTVTLLLKVYFTKIDKNYKNWQLKRLGVLRVYILTSSRKCEEQTTRHVQIMIFGRSCWQFTRFSIEWILFYGRHDSGICWLRISSSHVRKNRCSRKTVGWIPLITCVRRTEVTFSHSLTVTWSFSLWK